MAIQIYNMHCVISVRNMQSALLQLRIVPFSSKTVYILCAGEATSTMVIIITIINNIPTPHPHNNNSTTAAPSTHPTMAAMALATKIDVSCPFGL